MSFRRTFLDSALMSLANVLRLLAQFLVIPILSRLLTPEDYGLVGMAMPFLLFSMLFADAGVSLSLVRASPDQARVWSTCFWLSNVLGACLALAMVLISPLIAWWLEQPALAPMLAVLGLVLLLQTLAAVPGALMHNKQRFRAIAAIEMTAIVVSMAVAVGAALIGQGAWALIWQQVAMYGMRSALKVVLAGYRPLWAFDIKEVREHIRFGRDVLGVNLANYFSRSLDTLVVGKALGALEAGFFSMAFQFVRLPLMVVTGPLQYVLYVRLAKVKDDAHKVQYLFLFATRMLALLVLPGVALVAVAHEPLFAVLLSEKWARAGQVFWLASLGAALPPVTGLLYTVLMAFGHTALRLRLAVELAVAWTVLLLLCVGWGIEALALAYSVLMPLCSLRAACAILPYVGCTAKRYWARIMPTGVVAVGVAAVYAYVALSLEGQLWQLSVAVLCLVLAWILCIAVQRRAIRDELAQLKVMGL